MTEFEVALLKVLREMVNNLKLINEELIKIGEGQ